MYAFERQSDGTISVTVTMGGFGIPVTYVRK